MSDEKNLENLEEDKNIENKEVKSTEEEVDMENDNNNTTTTTTTRELVGAQKIQTAGVVVADPQSRTIAQSPSFQAKKKRRQSLGGRRVSFAQPRELEEVREYYKVRNEEGHYPTILFFYSKREREKGNK